MSNENLLFFRLIHEKGSDQRLQVAVLLKVERDNEPDSVQDPLFDHSHFQGCTKQVLQGYFTLEINSNFVRYEFG